MAESSAKKRKSIEANLKKNKDSTYNAQKGTLTKNYNNQKTARTNNYKSQTSTRTKNYNSEKNSINNVYSNAKFQSESDKKIVQKNFEEARDEINESAYDQAQATMAQAYAMGLNNSQQMIGLQQGDNSRQNKANQSNMGDRNDKIADILSRLTMEKKETDQALSLADTNYNTDMAMFKDQYNNDLFGLKSAYDNDLSTALNTINAQYQKSLADLDITDYQSIRDLEKQKSLMAQEHANKVALMNKQHSQDMARARASASSYKPKVTYSTPSGTTSKSSYTAKTNKYVSSYQQSKTPSTSQKYYNDMKARQGRSIIDMRPTPLPIPKVFDNPAISQRQQMDYFLGSFRR